LAIFGPPHTRKRVPGLKRWRFALLYEFGVIAFLMQSPGFQIWLAKNRTDGVTIPPSPLAMPRFFAGSHRLLYLCVSILLVASLPARSIPVSGTIVDSAGHPVPSAQIAWEPASFANVHFHQGDGESHIVAGPDGTFALDIARSPVLGPPAWRLNGAVALATVTAPDQGLWIGTLSPGTNRITMDAPFNATGVVVDAEGNGLAGVRVRYAGSNPAPGEKRVTDYEMVDITAVTGRDGTWTLPGLPSVSSLFVAIDDPRYLSDAALTGPGVSARLTAKPGATLEGKVLSPEGKPVPGLIIWLTSALTLTNAGQRTVTRADGSYSFTGLPAASTVLSLADPNCLWFAGHLTIPEWAPGTKLTAPDWTATKGVELTAHLISAADKSPLPGAGIRIAESAMSIGWADDQGNVDLHFPAGEGYLTIFGANDDCVTQWKSISIPAGTGTDALGDFALEPGVMLSGTALTPNGQPATGAALIMDGQIGLPSSFAQVDEKGTFSVGPVPVSRQVTIRLADPDDWIQTAPVTVRTAAVGGVAPPIHIVLTEPKFTPVSGRVIDKAGLPLPNVKVNVWIATTNGNVLNRMATTDQSGTFAFPRVHDVRCAVVEDLTLSGYAMQSPGMSSGAPVTDGAVPGPSPTVISDCVMVPMDGTVTGQVIGGDGRPVAGALVMALPPEGTPFTGSVPLPFPKTGTDGRFSLDHLPDTTLCIMAAQGKEFGEVTVPSGADTKIQLAPAASLDANARLDLLKAFPGRDFSQLLQYWDYLGPDKLREMALRLDGAIAPDGTTRDERAGQAFGEWLMMLAERDPKRAASTGPALLTRFDPKARQTDARAAIAAACAQDGDLNATKWANSWVEEENKPGAEPDPENNGALRLFRVAGVAAALHRTDGPELLDLALAASDREAKAGVLRDAPGWGESLAPGGLETLHRLDGEFTAPVRYVLWAAAVPALARHSPPDGSGAMVVVDQLQKDPEVIAFGAKQAATGWDQTANTEKTAKAALLLALARSGDPAVLKDAAAADSWMATPAYQALAVEALARNDISTATSALRVGGSLTGLLPNPVVYYGSLAATVNPDLSQLIFKSFAPSALLDPRYNVPSMDTGMYAYYHGFIDPAQSRLMLEASLRWQLPRAPASYTDFNGRADMAQMSRASDISYLFPLDPVRSLALLNREPKIDGPLTAANARVLALMFSDPAQWPVLPPE